MEPVDSFDVLYKALFKRDKYKRIQTLRTLIDSGIDVNSCWNKKCKLIMGCEREGLTVLILAAQYGYVDYVQVLLDAGANVNQSDPQGQTALIKAAITKHDECVRILLEAGADADHSNMFKETALTCAASRKDDKCAKLLIEAGVNVNYSANNEGTVLIISTQLACFKCMELLLEAGANVNGVDTRGNTALIYCVHYFGYRDSKACLKLLINAGADIDFQNNKSLQPIHFALKLWKHLTFLAEYLISENCNLNQVSYDQVNNVCRVQFKEEDRLDILKFLFACGLPRHLCQSFIVEKETCIRNWVQTVASQPNTLKSICIFKIRRSLGLGIKSKVTKLNLPNVIQNLILLKGILSFECFN